MKSQPLISVIVPVYNVSPYLRHCMDSVCGQTYRNLEILCVDDGSTDGSLDILREYEAKDPRVRVFSQPNAGVSAARNVALDAATGEWIVGLDPDDWLEPCAYETAMQGVRKDVDLVVFGVRVLTEEGSGLEEVVQETHSYLNGFSAGFLKLTDKKLQILSATVWNKLYRHSVIEENELRFEEELRSTEDTCFNACFYAHARAAFLIAEPLYCHMLRAGSITFTQSLEKDEFLCAMNVLCMEKIFRHYLKKGLVDRYPIYLRERLKTTYRMIIKHSSRGGSQKKWVAAYESMLKECFQKDCPELLSTLPELFAASSWLRQAEQLVSSFTVEGSEAPRDAVHVAVVAEDECQMHVSLKTLENLRRALAGRRVCVHVVAGNVPQPSIARLWQFSTPEFAVRLYKFDEAQLSAFPIHDAQVSFGDVLRASAPILLNSVEKVLLLPCCAEVEKEAESQWKIDEGTDSVAVVLPAGDDCVAEEDVLFLDLRRIREAGKTDAWLVSLFLHYSWLAPDSSEALRSAFPGAVGGFAHDCGVKVSLTPSMQKLGLRDLERHTIARRHAELNRKLWKYQLMTNLTWGKRKRHYVERSRECRDLLRSLAIVEQAAALVQ